MSDKKNAGPEVIGLDMSNPDVAAAVVGGLIDIIKHCSMAGLHIEECCSDKEIAELGGMMGRGVVAKMISVLTDAARVGDGETVAPEAPSDRFTMAVPGNGEFH